MRVLRRSDVSLLLPKQQIHAILTWKAMRDYARHLKDSYGYSGGIDPYVIDSDRLEYSIKKVAEGAKDINLFQQKGQKLGAETRILMYYMGIADQFAFDVVKYRDGEDYVYYQSLEKMLNTAKWLAKKCRKLEERTEALYKRQQATGQNYMVAREMYRGTNCRA